MSRPPEAKLPGACCAECPLEQRPFVPGYGPPPGSTGIVIVGEAPGAQEAHRGVPFVGQSGQLLRSSLEYAGLDPETIYYTNVVKCHPPGNRVPSGAVRCCSPALALELRPYGTNGAVFGTAGATATQVLLGGRATQNTWHHKGRVLAMWHPAYVLRTPDAVYDLLVGCRKLAALGPGTPPLVSWRVLKTVEDLVGLAEAIEALPPGTPVCFDLETDQVRFWRHRILCIGFAYNAQHPTAGVIPEELVYADETKDVLVRLFNTQASFGGHNAKFDVKFLRHQLGVYNARFDWDTLIAHYALYENRRHALKPLLAEYLDVGDYEANLVQVYLSKQTDFYSKVPPDKLMEYNALDVGYNLLLWEELRREMAEDGVFDAPYKYPLMAVQPVLTDMELRGIPVSLERVSAVSQQLGSTIEELHARLEEVCGQRFNPRSPKQVSAIMYKRFKLPYVSGRLYKKGSTNKHARVALLEQLDSSSIEAKWLVDYGDLRSLAKIKSSYVDSLPEHMDENGRVHPDFLVYGTETGRMSARTPPIHSIPKPGTQREGQQDWGKLIRGVFVAEPDFVILLGDYSQAEMRVAAAMSGEPFLIESYLKGLDLHSEVARALYGDEFTKRQRQLCKFFNFAFIYGGTEYSFVSDVGMPLEEARAFVRRYNRVMPRLVAWRAEQFEVVRDQGYVEIPTGHRRRFPLLTRANAEDARKASVNAQVQGMAGQLTTMALIRFAALCHDFYPDTAYPFVTVHDSIGAQVHKKCLDEVARSLRSIMEGVGAEWFPQLPWVVDLETGPSWGELEHYELAE